MADVIHRISRVRVRCRFSVFLGGPGPSVQYLFAIVVLFVVDPTRQTMLVLLYHGFHTFDDDHIHVLGFQTKPSIVPPSIVSVFREPVTVNLTSLRYSLGSKFLSGPFLSGSMSRRRGF
jgi:hypothetical protein